MAEQRDAVVEPLRREAPERLDERPEERREEEAVRGQRGGVAPRDRVLGHQHVDRVGDGGATARPRLRARRATSPLQTSTTTASPTTASTSASQIRRRIGSLKTAPGPERDQDRRDVLDQERDPDRQPPDRDEVEPLHERDARDPEDDQVRQLAAGQPQALAACQREHEREAEERPGRADLRQLERRDPGLEHDLRDRAVEREQERSRDHHRVADGGPPFAAGLARDIGDVGHGPTTLPAGQRVQRRANRAGLAAPRRDRPDHIHARRVRNELPQGERPARRPSSPAWRAQPACRRASAPRSRGRRSGSGRLRPPPRCGCPRCSASASRRSCAVHVPRTSTSPSFASAAIRPPAVRALPSARA